MEGSKFYALYFPFASLSPRGVAKTDGEAADELMKALRRRNPSVLDVLVECLAEQQETNADLIKKIRNGEPYIALFSTVAHLHSTVFPERPHSSLPATNESQPVTRYDDWPAPIATTPTSHLPIPPPPEVNIT